MNTSEMYGKNTLVIDAKKLFGKASVTIGDSIENYSMSDSNSWSKLSIPLEYAWVLTPLFFDANQRAEPKTFFGKVSPKLSSFLRYDVGEFDAGLKPNFPKAINDKLKVYVSGENGNMKGNDLRFGRGMNGLTFTSPEIQIFGVVEPSIVKETFSA